MRFPAHLAAWFEGLRNDGSKILEAGQRECLQMFQAGLGKAAFGSSPTLSPPFLPFQFIINMQGLVSTYTPLLKWNFYLLIHATR